MTNHLKQLALFGPQQEIAETTPKTNNHNGQRPNSYTGIYAMHKYWSKKPYNLVAHYIEKYTEYGGIILDPFCGSGVTAIESLRLGRRTIAMDINPIAVTSTRMGIEHIEIKSLKKAFEFLRRETEQEINDLYRTNCPKCANSNAIATHIIWNGPEINEIWVECKACRIPKIVKPPIEADKIAALTPSQTQCWYPTTTLIENHRINAKLGTRISDLFTPRALSNLSLLLKKIRQIEDNQIRSVMEFCFSAMLPQTSNMVFVIRHRGKATGKDENGSSKPEVGSWVIGYWMPPEHFEIHVWRCFESRFRKILKGKQEVNHTMPFVAKECISFDELDHSQQGYWVNKGTATDLSAIPSNSIDYVFTDPPHGNRIPYLELSLIWNSWLGFNSDWEAEIIISEAKSRKKDAQDYQHRLKLAFSEIYRVLKPDSYVSIAFNSLDDNTWLSFFNTLLAIGFGVRELNPLEYSAHSVVQDTRKNALKTDFVITCQKQPTVSQGQIVFGHSAKELSEIIRNYLNNRKDGAATYEIMNHLLITNIPNGVMFKLSQMLKTIETIAVFKNGRWLLKLP